MAKSRAKRKPSKSDLLKLKEILDKTPEGRRMLSAVSPKYFVETYFAEPLLPHQVRWADRLIGTWRGGIVAPPGHGKTRYIGRYHPLHEICQNRNIRILIISKNAPQAEKRLKAISHELESNQRLIADYGRFYDRDNKWTDKIIQVIRDRNLEEGTVEAVGMLKGITGNRVDLIILDDCIDALTCRTAGQREKVLDYVKDTITTRLDRNGRLLFIGTRFHPYDLYGYFIEHPLYDVIVEKAVHREPKKYSITRVDNPDLFTKVGDTLIPYQVIFEDNYEGECLAPELVNMAELMLIKKDISSATFRRIYQSDAQADEFATIKSRWLNACKDETLSYDRFSRKDYVAVIEGIDPALVTSKREAEETDSDYTVFATLGVREDGHFDLIGLKRDRGLTPNQIRELFVKNAKMYDSTRQYIETNAHGEALRWKVKDETGVPVKKHKTTGKSKYDPYEGLSSVATMFENEQIRLPYRTEDDREITDRLCNELSSAPSEDGHDDQLSALWIGIAGARKYIKWMDKLKVKQSVAAQRAQMHEEMKRESTRPDPKRYRG